MAPWRQDFMSPKFNIILTLTTLALGVFSQVLRAIEIPPVLTASGWQWQQTQMNNGDLISPDQPQNYHLRFREDGTLAIQVDCNQAQARFEIEDHRLRIELGPMTLMACGETSLGDRFMANLNGANSFFFRDGNLYIELKFDSGTMKFSPQDVGLIGTHWRVTGYNNGRGGLVGVQEGPQLHLTFAKEGTLDGSAGCNHFSAPFNISGDQITLGPVMTTRKFCQDPPGIMEQESAFLSALPKASRFERTGDRLELRMVDDALVATLNQLQE
jgi:heat shock protein HslJ